MNADRDTNLWTVSTTRPSSTMCQKN